MAQRVLITGSAGRIGRAAVAALAAAGHDVTGFDLHPTPGLPADRTIIGTLQDHELLQRAVAGKDVVIHLAATPDDVAYPRPAPPHDRDNFLSELLPNNVVGLYHLLEAARREETPRLILASTGQTIAHRVQAGPWPVDEHTPYAPRYWYAATKIFLEGAALAYSEAHALTTVVVRLGWCPRDARQVAEIAASEIFQDVYLSPGDAGRFFLAAATAEKLPRHLLVYSTSKFTHRCRYDLTSAQQHLGYKPQDRWPTGALP